MVNPSVEFSPAEVGRRAGTLFSVEGILLLALGVIAVFLPLLAEVAITLFLGWLLFFGGIVGLVATFAAKRMPGFVWSLISGLLSLGVGVLLIASPWSALFSVTLILIAFFFADGLVTVIYSISHRRGLVGRWEWMLASGAVTMLLATIIALGLPGSAAWALGLVVGIDMIMAGTSLLAVGTALRSSP